jgi:hypothetical protein
MKLAKGNMFNTPTNVYCVTTNQYVTVNGRVVMGRGAAFTAKTLFHGLDYTLGGRIMRHQHSNPGTPYYLLYAGEWVRYYGDVSRGVRIYGFQVKNHFRDDAKLDLIAHSANMLHVVATALRPQDTYSLNFPGIGNGRLSRKQVMPLLETLPDNVTVWEL